MTTARDIGLVTCTSCARVWPGTAAVCERCGTSLASREARSLQRVWGWLAAGALCYVPALSSPMLVTETLTQRAESTIIGGAVEIAQHGDYGIALIVIVASVVIPITKFLAIGYLCLSVHRRSASTLLGRMRLYEIIEFIGRWSMIDVFVVAILSALVQLSVVASIQPGPAALTFAFSVIFTMLAARSFDTRLIWDNLPARQQVAR